MASTMEQATARHPSDRLLQEKLAENEKLRTKVSQLEVLARLCIQCSLSDSVLDSKYPARFSSKKLAVQCQIRFRIVLRLHAVLASHRIR